MGGLTIGFFAVCSEGQDSVDDADHADGCVPLADFARRRLTAATPMEPL